MTTHKNSNTTDYCFSMPVYKVASSPVLEKEAFVPLVVAGGFALKALMAAMAAKGVYDIGTKNVPGMIREGIKGNWRGVGRNALSAGSNALFALPGIGVGGKALQMAGKGGKLLRLGGTAGKLRTAAKATGVSGRVAGGMINGIDRVNRGAGQFMRGGAGGRLMPAANRLTQMRNNGPSWMMRPEGFKDNAKYIGAIMGSEMGGSMLDPQGAQGGLPIQHKVGPAAIVAGGLRPKRPFFTLNHGNPNAPGAAFMRAARRVGPTGAMRYRL